MPKESKSPVPEPDTYRFNTLRPWNSLVFILPLLIFFQIGAFFCDGTKLLAPYHLGKLLEYFGATGIYLPAIFIVVVLLIQHITRRENWQIQPKLFAGMVCESIIWMVPLICLGELTGKLIAQAASLQASGGGAFQQAVEKIASNETFEAIVAAFGAGIYEEFIFRLVLISLFLFIFVDIFDLRKDITTIAGVIAAAVLFSLYHFSLEQIADLGTFPWSQFIFRAMAGVYLGGLFIYRGFGIAVGAHICYNLFVVITKGA